MIFQILWCLLLISLVAVPPCLLWGMIRFIQLTHSSGLRVAIREALGLGVEMVITFGAFLIFISEGFVYGIILALLYPLDWALGLINPIDPHETLRTLNN